MSAGDSPAAGTTADPTAPGRRPDGRAEESGRGAGDGSGAEEVRMADGSSADRGE